MADRLSALLPPPPPDLPPELPEELDDEHDESVLNQAAVHLSMQFTAPIDFSIPPPPSQEAPPIPVAENAKPYMPTEYVRVVSTVILPSAIPSHEENAKAISIEAPIISIADVAPLPPSYDAPPPPESDDEEENKIETKQDIKPTETKPAETEKRREQNAEKPIADADISESLPKTPEKKKKEKKHKKEKSHNKEAKHPKHEKESKKEEPKPAEPPATPAPPPPTSVIHTAAAAAAAAEEPTTPKEEEPKAESSSPAVKAEDSNLPEASVAASKEVSAKEDAKTSNLTNSGGIAVDISKLPPICETLTKPDQRKILSFLEGERQTLEKLDKLLEKETSDIEKQLAKNISNIEKADGKKMTTLIAEHKSVLDVLNKKHAHDLKCMQKEQENNSKALQKSRDDKWKQERKKHADEQKILVKDQKQALKEAKKAKEDVKQLETEHKYINTMSELRMNHNVEFGKVMDDAITIWTNAITINNTRTEQLSERQQLEWNQCIEKFKAEADLTSKISFAKEKAIADLKDTSLQSLENRKKHLTGSIEEKISLVRELVTKKLNEDIKQQQKEYQLTRKQQTKDVEQGLKQQMKTLAKNKASKNEIKKTELEGKTKLEQQLAKQDTDHEMQQVAFRQKVEDALRSWEDAERSEMARDLEKKKETISQEYEQKISESREETKTRQKQQAEKRDEKLRTMKDDFQRELVSFLNELHQAETQLAEHQNQEANQLLISHENQIADIVNSLLGSNPPVVLVQLGNEELRLHQQLVYGKKEERVSFLTSRKKELEEEGIVSLSKKCVIE